MGAGAVPGPAGSRIASAVVAAALALVALSAAVAWVLAPVAEAGFVFDDAADVVENPATAPSAFWRSLGVTNRPLLKATYALQRAWHGDAPAPFHRANLLLHLACLPLVFALCRRALARPAPDERGVALAAAWVATALWALHPVAAETVAPVTGRSHLLSTALLLGALLLATGARPPGRARMLAAAALALAAPLARETALVLPALLLLWQATLGLGEGRAAVLRRQLPVWSGTALAALLLALGERQRELVAYSLAARPPLEALRGNVHALVEILALWLAPWRLSADPAPPPDLPWAAPATLTRLALLAAAGLIAATARRRHPRAAFAAGWTLLALLPANSLLWRLDPVSPRPLYLAGIGLALLAGIGARHLGGALSSAPRRSRAIRAGAGALGLSTLALLALAAHGRAALWAEPAALWADAAAKAPDRPRPWTNLGIELLLADRLDAAEIALLRASELAPAESAARCALDAIRIRRLAAGHPPPGAER
ncbi:MAG: hypothetical protein KJ058_04755 [Thermoanaerobaculia bacterium]|nr:hypothetical protein [Thermoanaerobaculia bacterium]